MKNILLFNFLKVKKAVKMNVNFMDVGDFSKKKKKTVQVKERRNLRKVNKSHGAFYFENILM